MKILLLLLLAVLLISACSDDSTGPSNNCQYQLELLPVSGQNQWAATFTSNDTAPDVETLTGTITGLAANDSTQTTQLVFTQTAFDWRTTINYLRAGTQYSITLNVNGNSCTGLLTLVNSAYNVNWPSAWQSSADMPLSWELDADNPQQYVLTQVGWQNPDNEDDWQQQSSQYPLTGADRACNIPAGFVPYWGSGADLLVRLCQYSQANSQGRVKFCSTAYSACSYTLLRQRQGNIWIKNH